MTTLTSSPLPPFPNLLPSRRHSLLRDAILSLLGTYHLLTAPELLKHLHKVGRKVNKTSMYRALEILLASKLICRQSFEQQELYYELATLHHDHAVCRSCGKVFSIKCKEINEVWSGKQESGAQETTQPILNGFSIEHHHITFFGLCALCQTA